MSDEIPPPSELKTRVLDEEDCQTVSDIIAHFASQAILLWRTPEDVRKHMDCFLIGEIDGQPVGCVALQDYGQGLYELRSLAVKQDFWGKGLGSQLIHAAVDLGKVRNANRIFALTKRPGLFLRNGFVVTQMDEFPQKVWNDCKLCPKRENCVEVAVKMDL